MKHKPCLIFSLFLLLAAASACRNNDRQDTVLTSAANPSHTWRATVLLRQYFVDGKLDNSPTTYVLLDRITDKNTAKPGYANGAEFTEAQVVMKPAQCGPLGLEWLDDQTLKVICEKCGLALSAVGQHASAKGPVRIQYDNFPVHSSWESGGQPN